ncbi:hypothetical protein T11_12778 [Trichinella zimbabwensis]|uniref:Uncharacterized protein n=1 Tax=Trichinella zimbabwensis TaxID=268475 RepID=A0A0V1HQN0_9BILA|nr:hypothetical protein T11_7323 [Trichinella zimbabwensis]KRZ12576.1 hypothetical protein T11_12778 [Trichinella zimbabwensis]
MHCCCCDLMLTLAEILFARRNEKQAYTITCAYVLLFHWFLAYDVMCRNTTIKNGSERWEDGVNMRRRVLTN